MILCLPALSASGRVVTGCSKWPWLSLLHHQLSKDVSLLQGRCLYCPNVHMKPGSALPAFEMQGEDALGTGFAQCLEQFLLLEGPGEERWEKPAAPEPSPWSSRVLRAGNTSFVSKWVRRRRDVTIAMGKRFHNFIL